MYKLEFMPTKSEIRGLLPNIDQAKFVDLASRAVEKLCKRAPDGVTMISYSGPGKSYCDFVVSLRCSRDGRKFEVYRNRDGELVLAVDDGEVTAISFKYIFIERHLRSKLGEPLDG